MMMEFPVKVFAVEFDALFLVNSKFIVNNFILDCFAAIKNR